MKKAISSITILFILTCSLTAQNQGERNNIKKGHVTYNITGSLQHGNEDLYFDKSGSVEAKYTTLKIKMGGFTQETKSAVFTEGDWIYTVDLKTKTGTKQQNPILKNMKGKKIKDVGKEWMIRMDGKKIGKGTILGKPCEIWLVQNLSSKIWVWNWVPLKMEVDMGGMKMTYIATKISTTFDKKKLRRPTNIKYKDTGDILKNFRMK